MPAAYHQTTVLIVDDSRLARRALRTIFESHADFRVVGEAGCGREAVAAAQSLAPRLVTMDLDMPDGNGLDAIEQIMAFAPTRIMVITGVPHFRGADATFEALSRGALELIPKPSAWPATEPEQQQIIGLARRLAAVPVLLHPRAARHWRQQANESRVDSRRPRARLVAIGASTGGPRALKAILAGLPAAFPAPIVVVQHLADVFTQGFIDWLGSGAGVPVREALPGMRLEPGVALVATRGAHVRVTSRGGLEASHEPPRDGLCPAIDVLFESVAEHFGAVALGALLTGMGMDGARGLKRIADAGGLTVVQDEASSVVFGMPKAAIDLGAAQRVMGCDEIAAWLAQSVGPANGRLEGRLSRT